MRIRLWSVFIVAGLCVGAFVLPWARVPAGEGCGPAPTPCGPRPVCPPPAPTAHVEAIKEEAAPAVGKVPTMVVNSRRIRLNFSISDVGPSGVSSVELWCTRDGQAWQRYSSEPPPAGPLVVHVAEEGRYGFSLVVKSGVGASSPPPRTGDAPQLWVEVDETRPHVRVLHAELGKGLDDGCLVLSWAASDVNLIPRPITLSTSTSKDGPWTPVVNNLENTGKYVWRTPRDVPYQFYVRVEATDRAGNVTADCWPEPIKVDRACPKGVILGIEPEKKVVDVVQKERDLTGALAGAGVGQPAAAK
jgi:hypothetical protein